jgi:hypothetical protein
MRYRFVGALVFAVCLGCLAASAAPQQLGEQIPPSQQAPGEPLPTGEYYPQGTSPSGRMAPPALTLPAGTLITVRTTDLLSSDRNRPGDSFTTVLDQPIVVQGWVAARRGQFMEGRVAVAQNAGRVQGVSQLAVELSGLAVVDGQQVNVRTQLVQSTGVASPGRDAQGIGVTTGMGAVIGAAAGGGKGAAIGAAAGAVAGIAGVLTTRGRPAEIYPETLLTFRLEEPVTINTEQSRQAFQPVTQQDYDNSGMQRNPPRYQRADTYRDPGPYYYPPRYYPPYLNYGGFYGFYGFGPRIYVGPSVFWGRGFYRHR